jgi:NitT/TauT family transport system substrate-binding protein
MRAGILLALGLSLFACDASAKGLGLILPTFGLESLPVYEAQEQGYFAKRGLEVEVSAARGGGEAMKAFISGDVTILATGFPEVGELKARGVDVVMLVGQLTRSPFAVVARKDLNITSIAGLKGKDIGVSSPGSMTESLARYLAIRQGWDPKRDIGVVALGGGGEILGALVGKKVDAAVLFEPFASSGIRDGKLTMVMDLAKEMDAFPTAPLVVHREFLEKSPKEARGLHDAMVEALAYIHANRDGAFALVRKKFPGADPEVLKAAYDRLYPIFSPDGKLSRASLERTQKICMQLGLIHQIYAYDDIVAPFNR